ncbi:MAG TPA: putative toxin-antitoxin system toxin component, PIN family [Burkholderiales bacterium]|nr:putative toxin-antitoxin system toxin component, PIN family [Burkholderiales bacterium]
MRVVLDSNVWIDWLVFDDPAVAPLKAARDRSTIEIAIDAPCLAELAAVLAYPEFKLDATAQAAKLADVLAIARRWHGTGLPAEPRLPRCTDADDQKFIDLAHASEASWLITRDKALLQTGRRLQRSGIRVGTPVDWIAATATAA